MPIVKRDSRCRVGVLWFDSEPEADAYWQQLKTDPAQWQSIADANIGYVQCGRSRFHDTEVDGKPAYAVVTP